jgi:peptide/nickel transport system permease protein
MTVVETLAQRESIAVPVEPIAPVAAKKIKKPWGFAFWMAVTWLVSVVVSTFVANLANWKKEVDFLGGAEVVSGNWRGSINKSHPLGLNLSGNDILVDLVRGAKNSLVIAGTTVLLGFLIGGTLGMIAGYFKGRVDTVLSFMANILLSVPPLLFILLMIAVLSSRGGDGQAQGLSSSVFKVSLALGILSVPQIFRVVRASTLQFSQREFVMAARAMGAKVPRILLREILPNVAKPMLAYGLVAAGSVMVIEGGLSFLGIGVGSGTDVTAWGKQIAAASQRADLEKAPMAAFIPGLALFLTVLSFNYIGDKVRERLETKQGAL